jgi:hypothetical protein
LANLERKYAKNEILRFPAKKHIQVHIDWALRDGNTTLAELKDELAQQGIEMAVRRTEQGRTYGVTFVDLRSKTAFKGSDMGKQYSAKGLEQRCDIGQEPKQQVTQRRVVHRPSRQKQSLPSGQAQSSGPTPAPSPPSKILGHSDLAWIWEELFRPTPQQPTGPYDQDYYKKKKKPHW